MTLKDFIKLIFKKKQTFVSIFFIFLLVAGCVVVVQRPKYGSSSKIITIHEYREAVDPYVSSRSNDYLSGLFTRIVYSNSFFDKVMASDFSVNKDYFKGSETKKMKTWSRTVKAKSIADTGIIELEVYHPEKSQAEQISKAIIFTLQTNHSLYHGFGNNVKIKEIDTPTTSTYPVKPDIALIFSLTVALAFFCSVFYVYLLPEERYDIRLWPKRKAKKARLVKEEVEDNWSSIGEVIKDRQEAFPPEFVPEPIMTENAVLKEEEEQEEGRNFTEGNMNNILR